MGTLTKAKNKSVTVFKTDSKINYKYWEVNTTLLTVGT